MTLILAAVYRKTSNNWYDQ